jgi:DnaK suppressor protein
MICNSFSRAKPGRWESKGLMEKKRLDVFKKQLEERQKELRHLVSRTEEDGRSTDGNDVAQDIVDRASSSYQKEFLFHHSNSVRGMLQNVENALSRINEGSYGECANCGNEIEPKRLEAVPWARHCLKCQELMEQGQLQ